MPMGLFHLGADALPGYRRHPPGARLHGPGSPRLDGKAQLGGEAHRPKHPQGVLGKAALRLPHAPHHPRRQVLPPAEEVHYPPVPVQGHGVDGEVPAAQVLLQGGVEGHGVRVAAVSVALLPAEGGHLHRHGAGEDGNRAVLEPCGDGPAKEGHHLLRQRRGGHVPVPRRPAQQQVPHTPSHREGLLPRRPQPAAQPAHRGRYPVPIHLLCPLSGIFCLLSVYNVYIILRPLMSFFRLSWQYCHCLVLFRSLFGSLGAAAAFYVLLCSLYPLLLSIPPDRRSVALPFVPTGIPPGPGMISE